MMRSLEESQRLGRWLGSDRKAECAVVLRHKKRAQWRNSKLGSRYLTDQEVDEFFSAVTRSRNRPVEPTRFYLPGFVVIPPTVSTMAFQVRGLKPIVVGPRVA